MSRTAAAVRPSRFALLANPTRFMEISGRVLPYAYALAGLLLVAGLGLALQAPEDYQQGITVRILFVHVPFAWLSMMTWTVMSASALGLLVWRHPIAEVAIRAAAPIGAVFTFLCLFTGSVWGRPMWGTWWVWDARLTSVFVLFLMYLALIALSRAFEEPQRAGRMSAIFVLVGFLVIPVIKFSVDWWNTLHQPASVLRMGGPTLDASYLWPLFLNAAGFTTLFFALHLTAMRTELRRRRIASLERRRAGASS